MRKSFLAFAFLAFSPLLMAQLSPRNYDVINMVKAGLGRSGYHRYQRLARLLRHLPKWTGRPEERGRQRQDLLGACAKGLSYLFRGDGSGSTSGLTA